VGKRKGLAHARLRGIIEELRLAGADITYSAVAARYGQTVGAKNGAGCSPNTIYAVFREMGVSYGIRPRRTQAKAAPGNIFAPPYFGQISAQKFSCCYCRYWRVSIEDLSNDDQSVRLECRRMPPREDFGTSGRWPTVSPIEWCGEFEENQEAFERVTASYLGHLHFAGGVVDGRSLEVLASRLGAIPTNELGAVKTRIREFSRTSLEVIRAGCDKLRASGAIIPNSFVLILDEVIGEKINN